MSMSTRWMLANLVGFAAGAPGFGALQRIRMQPYFGVVTEAGPAARVVAVSTTLTLTVFGLILGTAQWLVLRRRWSVGWWVPATTVGWALVGVLGGALSGAIGGNVSTVGPALPWATTLAIGLPAGVVIGLLPGLAGWFVLRRWGVGRWWPLRSLAGLGLGLTVAFAVVRWGLVDVVPWLRPEDFPSAKALVLIGAVTAPVYAALTRPALSTVDQ
jgi:hypothetical protein